MQLNDIQQAAVLHRDGPAVVFAGAGSGKTRIITQRIAHLIKTGVKPQAILAVTFTNKAADEMRDRVLEACPAARGCLISTFHSVCARWLREFAPELGFTSDFTIYDDADQNATLKAMLKETYKKADLTKAVSEMKNFFHMAKTSALLPMDIEREFSNYAEMVPAGGLHTYKKYQEYLAQCNAMDFGDLLLNVLLLLRKNKMVREILQRRYQYVLIDEYQDTNQTQFELINRLVEVHKNLFVVGDDDQSIYSWRGATPANIIDFEKYYPDVKKITMDQNYRCAQNIVDAATAMVSRNKVRVPKKLWTSNPPGPPIEYRMESDGEMEAWWICECIDDEGAEFPFDQVAIFYRTNSQSRTIEEALRRKDIPYRIFGGVRFYDRVEIKDLLAFIRLTVNPSDDIALKRIINVPTRGLGAKAVEKLEEVATTENCSLFDAISKAVQMNIPRVSTKLEAFLSMFLEMEATLKSGDMNEVVKNILHYTGYAFHIEKKYPEQASDKMDNLHELAAGLAEYAKRNPDHGLKDWLQSVSLNAGDEQADNESGVTLMTLHMAKGLEYPRVYITGVEDGLLPHRNSMDDLYLTEEERRLFYVGMTRAKKKLTLTSAYKRRTYDSWVANDPSIFLSEIPDEYLVTNLEAEADQSDLTRVESGGDGQYYYDYDDEPEGIDLSQLSPGTRVYHHTYGPGAVDSLASDFGEVKVIVDFTGHGKRKVMLRHLTLTR